MNFFSCIAPRPVFGLEATLRV